MSLPDGSKYHDTASSALVGSDTLAAIKPVWYAAGTQLFRAGDPDDMLWIVLSGEIGLIHEHDRSSQSTEHVFGPEAILGSMAVFGPETIKHHFSGRAITDVQVLVVPREQIDALLQREPLVAYQLLRNATHYMRKAEQDAMREMEAKNAQLELAYSALRTAQRQLFEHERLQHELLLARELQEQMLPGALPRVDGIDLGARILPALEVSGDFYDLFMLDGETLGVLIGDVSGKGMPAALYMAQSRSLLRAAAGLPQPPEMVLRVVNNLLHEMNSGTMFVTCILARLHVPTRSVVIARAGHERPLLYASGGAVRLLPRAVGQPLGIIQDPEIDVQELVLDPGDMLLLFTDGVTEAIDQSGTFFGDERLYTATHACSVTTAQKLCDHIVDRLAAFQDGAPQADDITLVAVHAS